MKEKFQQTITSITTAIKDSVTDLGNSAREKSGALIESWLLVFPELEKMGLVVTSFGVSLAISPALEVELAGASESFNEERLEALMEEYAEQTSIMTVLKTIRMTRNMYGRLRKELTEEIFVKITVRVPPQVQVFFGRPVIM